MWDEADMGWVAPDRTGAADKDTGQDTGQGRASEVRGLRLHTPDIALLLVVPSRTYILRRTF